MRDSIKIITLSTIVCSVFIGATYLHAEWSNPPSNPPGGNVAAPISTSDSVQVKDGDGRIGADQLRAFSLIRSFGNMRVANNIWSENNIRAENLLITENQVRSDTYCDRWGNNCFSPADVGGAGQEYESCGSYDHGETRDKSNQCGSSCPMHCYTCPLVDSGTEQCQDGTWVTTSNQICGCTSGP